MIVRRALLSIKVPLSALAIFLLYLLTGAAEGDVINSYKIGTDYREMLIFLSACPAVSLFAQDWKSNVWRPIAVRISMRRYAAGLLLGVWLTTLLTAMAGQWAYILYLHRSLPILGEITFTQPWASDILGGVLLYRHPYLYLAVQTLCAALVCATFASTALWVSALIPDRLIAHFAPLVLYYTVCFGVEFLKIPYPFGPDYQLIGYLTDDPGTDALIMSAHLALPLVILPLLSRTIERRCGHG
jgi:hypothetical protein